MKKVKKILLAAGIGIIALMLLGFVLSYIYEDEVKEFAIKKIQEQLLTDFQISDSQLSIWKQFPNASLELNNIYIEETFESADTLIFAKKVFLEFNLTDLFSGNYVVDEITIDDAFLGLKWDEVNRDNFHFWKSGNDPNSEFQFEVETINIRNTLFQIDQKSNDFYLESFISDARASGKFTAKVFDLEVNSKLVLNSIKISDDTYAKNNDITLNYSIKIDNEKSEYSFNEGQLNIDGLNFIAGGMIKNLEEGNFCNLSFTGNSLPVKKSRELVPEKYLETLSAYKFGGDFDATCELTGYAGNGKIPDIGIDFELQKVDFTHYKSGVTISDIQAKAHFEKKQNQPELLAIKELNADFEKGLFSVVGTIQNFISPTFDLRMIGNIDLKDFKRFTESESMENTEGKIRFDSHFEGSLSSLNPILAAEVNALKSSADIELNDAIFKLKGSDHLFEHLNGRLIIDGKKAQLKGVNGHVGPSDFKMEGNVSNLLAYILVEGEIMEFDAYLNSELLDFNNLLANDQSKTNEDQYNLTMPKGINFNFHFNVAELRFREFNAESVKGLAKLKNQIFEVDPLEFKTSQGKLLGTFRADCRDPENFLLSSKLKIDRIDVNQLFAEFENFGQEFLVQENIKGTATADIDFSATVDSHLNFDSNKIYSLIDITIDDGELINLTSMKEICSYIRSNKLVAPFVDEDKLEEKLKHIYFSELHNKIEIKNQKISIPEMNILSSAMDISAEGNHHFDNHIDYTLGFNVRDILCKDSRTEFGIVEDDGLGNLFFLSMTGTTTNPQFGYDRLAHKEKRQEDFDQEKNVLKELVKNEFRKEENKNDSIVKDDTNEKVIIVVDDGKKKKKKKNWFDDEEDEDKEKSPEIDDDDF